MFDDLYSNIGRKIKILAKVIAFMGTIGCIICGCIFAFLKILSLSLFCIIGGPLLSWISSFTLYGFGVLVENSEKSVNSKQKTKNDKATSSKTDISSTIDHTENVFIINEKAESNTKIHCEISQTILEFIDSQLNNLSKTTIQKIMKEYSIWHKDIQSLTDKDLISILETPNNWQSEYILLCCIELKRRNQNI